MATRLLSIISTNGFICVGVRTVVALPDAHSDRPQRVRVVDDLTAALEGDPAEAVVRQTVLDQDGGTWITTQVDRLLGLGLRLEPDDTVDEREPHRDRVRVTRGTEGDEVRRSAASG